MMASEIIEILRDAFENAKEVIDRFVAVFKKVLSFFDKEEEVTEETE